MAGHTNSNLRSRTAVAGIGESRYTKRGQSPHDEFVLALQAILAACADAGIDPRDIDGFASYSDDRNDPSRLAAALGCRELRLAIMQWGGGGGGCAAAVGNAAAAIATGMAQCVVVFRALAQGAQGRYGLGQSHVIATPHDSHTVPHGLISPAQLYAMKYQRFAHEHDVRPEALRAIAMASYRHAQSNPRAVMFGRPLDEATYDAARWIVEPWRLFDCCQENDGAAAIILVAADRAKDLPHTPCYLLGAAAGSDQRAGAPVHNAPDYATASFKTVAGRLYEMSGLSAKDVDVLQSYENFTGGVLMSIVEHGFCDAAQVNDFMQLDNLLAPHGRLPLNTSGGNLAECYVHGFGLVVEAVRQIRGTSTAQVPDAQVSMVTGGPMVTPVSSVIFGSEATR